MRFLLSNFWPQHLEKISLLCCNKQCDVKEKVKVGKGSIRQLFARLGEITRLTESKT
jgi:hypothetical protein